MAGSGDSVLLIGAGGIGCGAAQALAAAGIPHIGVVDDDVVEVSNLQRQTLHSDATVGTAKTASLKQAVEKAFPETKVTTHEGRFTTDSAIKLLAQYRVVIDGSDNLETKFLANDAAVLAGVPLIHAAAVGVMGHVLTVPVGGRPCYRCLFEELPPANADAPSCAEAGVLGPIPGAIGALAAREAVVLLSGKTPTSTGVLFRYDSPPMTMRHIKFRPNPDCGVCGRAPVIRTLKASAYQQNEECSR